jgi:hypothetical protein
MAQNFVACNRHQELLLPWPVLEVVEELDLARFMRPIGSTGTVAALDPAMMVALLVYAYAVGVRSSRAGSSATV